MNSKITVYVTFFISIVVALFLGRAVGEGNKMHISMVFGIMIGAPFLLSLGKNYWYLIPASLLCNLPALPLAGRDIELAELSIVLCFGIFITRIAFKLDKVIIWRATHIPIYLFVTWVLFVFCLNPSGLGAFGSTTMGGRFYFKILLAFLAFIIIASREITDKDCKWIIGFIIFGSIVSAAYNIFSYFFMGVADEILASNSSAVEFYTWHQNLSGPALAISFILFAWKKPRDILGFKNPLLLFLYLVAIALALYSGKRTALVAIFLAPVVSAIIYKKYGYLFIGAILSILFALTVIYGHGALFRFPLQIQRTLCWLPADWDSEFRNLERGQDLFRESLRRFAMENIERHPLIGRGFTVQYSELMRELEAMRYLGGSDSQAAPIAAGRSWHNTWLGYAADFGIPLSVIQAIVYIVALIVSYKAANLLEKGSLKFIIASYIFLYTFRDMLFSHVVGHTAWDAFNRWWMYGMLCSLYASAIRDKVSKLSKIQYSNQESQKKTAKF